MHWSITHYLWAVAVAGVVVFLASLIPAKRAAKVEPGQVIRGGWSMSDAPETILEVRNLNRWLGDGDGRTHILRGLSFVLQGGKTYAVTGPSGCGKSTLLYLLGLLDKPDQGEIWFGKRRVDNASEEKRTSLRGSAIGFVFQFHFLLAEFTAIENVMLPMLKLGKWSEDECRARADKLLQEVGLGAKTRRLATQLSGGEQQRVAVARALANEPRLILADEPTGNLDHRNSLALFSLIGEVAVARGHSVLIVTHNNELAEQCDVKMPMMDGVMVNS